MLRTSTTLVFFAAAVMLFSQSTSAQLGLFEGSGDIGTVLHPGAVKFDPVSTTYTVTGSGANIWAVEDDFQFVWKKVSALNVTLAADPQFLETNGDHHRKGVLMIRQSLEQDSAYVDVAVHGDGLTSLQFRNKKGGPTQEIESNVSGPKRVKIEKRQALFSMWIGKDNGTMRFSGGAASVQLTAPFYVGIGVSAHDKDAIQSVTFTNLTLDTDDDLREPKNRYSSLITINVRSTDARVSEVGLDLIEQPAWSKDGKSLIYTVGGVSKTVPVSLYGSQPSSIPQVPSGNTGKFLSPDGTQQAVLFSAVTGLFGYSNLSIVSTADHTSKFLIEIRSGSLGEHPWSPDGKRLAYVAYEWMEE